MNTILTEDFSGRMNPYLHPENIKNINSIFETKGMKSIEENFKQICKKFSDTKKNTIKLNITDEK